MSIKKIFMTIVLLFLVLSYLSLFGCSHYSNAKNSYNEKKISRNVDADADGDADADADGDADADADGDADADADGDADADADGDADDQLPKKK